MVIKVYISGISGNKEVKKRQQRVVMILESKNIEYEAIDIAEPGKEGDKEFMQQNSKAKDSKYALPPQIFNEDEYCGDYEEFDLANELDELEKFLKVPAGSIQSKEAPSMIDSTKSPFTNGSVTSSREQSTEKEAVERQTVSSLSEDRISAENHEETEQDDVTSERQSPVKDSDSKDVTEAEGEEEEEETTAEKERSTTEEGANKSVDPTADDSEEDEEETEDEE